MSTQSSIKTLSLPKDLAIKLHIDQLTEKVIHGLPIIAHEDLTLIEERLLVDGALSANEIPEAISEYRKFMSLILITGGGLGMISRSVDEVWHTHILFTQDYFNFCERAFGRYVHHQPTTSKHSSDRSSVQKFKSTYKAVYGKMPRIWGNSPDCSGTTNCQDHDCVSCNGIEKCHSNLQPMLVSCQENSCDSESLCDGAEYPCSSEFGGG